MENYKKGLKAGIPIGLGYLSVSFTFGLMAVASGLYWWQAALISMTVLTSAGQLNAIQIMLIPGQFLDMLISQLTINVRYSFMSISLSQKTEYKFKGIYKWLLGFFMTDEIFAVAVQEKEVTRSYFFGVATIPYFGWSIGTIMGALIGGVLPEIILNALCLAIYGMFIAIITPIIKKSKKTLFVVIIAIVLSILFYYMPFLRDISTGISVSICAVLSAVIGAIVFPVKEDE